MATLIPDKDLAFPEFVLLKASAGSGKTHALSLRFVQFLLSERVKNATPNDLRNILAITFTRNAAREMKTRILDWLKECYFQDAVKTREILDIVSIPPFQLPGKAGEVVENILTQYTDFQVETIDSFMATIFRASAVDLGYSPDFEIVLDSTELIQYAFSRHLRGVTSTSKEGKIFRQILDHLSANLTDETVFPWDPTIPISETLVSLYKKLAVRNRTLETKNHRREREALQDRITQVAAEMQGLIEESGLELNTKGHCHSKILPAVRERRFTALIGCSFKTDPIKKPRPGSEEKTHQKILRSWEMLEKLVDRYKSYYARDFFYPYLLAYGSLVEKNGTLDRIKRRRGTVFIEDINKQLAEYIVAGIVPDIYLRLGDRIFHYLIDEFQDTNRIQWDALVPLIEESLSKAGSLFVVGDVKQAIYGFRDADYRIMQALIQEEAGFASVKVDPGELTKNYRSRERIQDFVKEIFLHQLPAHEDFRDLVDIKRIYEFDQDIIATNRNKGYVEVVVLAEDPESPPEKAELQDRVRELKDRGYSWSDIAVLTYRNESVAQVSSWLNEKGIPFIPFSSLDIRKRKIIGEVLAFLTFLDSPPDDLSFSVFLLGDVFRKAMNRDGRPADEDSWRAFLFECRESQDRPLYASFRKRQPALWERYFEPFFKTVGYYPLYDLVTLIYRVFDIFRLFPDEEAALTKFLEVIKDFEGKGRNDLQAFLEFTTGGESEQSGWTIDVPSETPAVRIMSIHKSKGLEFPAVLFLAYGEGFQSSDFYLGEDASTAAGAPGFARGSTSAAKARPLTVRVVKLNKNLEKADAKLSAIYREARSRDIVERLNRLYVGLTRAKAELHVIAVKGARDSYPFDLLNSAVEALHYELLGERRWASSRAKPPASPETRRTDSPDAEKYRVSGPFDLPPNRRESLGGENIRRGEIAHRIMAGFEFIRSGWEPDIAGVIRTLAPRESEVPLFEATGRSLIRYFEDSPLRDLFLEKAGRRALREFDFCDSTGAVFRMDRVVIDPAAVTVIDFKTGAEAAAPRQAEWERSDREQVAAYVRILKDIFPGKSVRGVLAYIDLNRWEPVG
ncbi:MAG: UvrD-helicase domain-containing protein [Candidatus Aminicenantes bacterium]|nr:UvrD-helicase domain-containing protein [Candidatus Aminicenantes bacterium]